MKSIYARQFAMLSVVILLSFFLLGASFFGVSYHYIIADRQTSLAQNARNIAEMTGNMLDQGMGLRSEYFRLYVSSVAKAANAQVILAETGGDIVLCASASREYADFTGETIPQRVLAAVEKKGEFQALSDLNSFFPTPQYVFACPIVVNQVQFGAKGVTLEPVRAGLVVMAVSPGVIMEIWRDFATIFLFVAVLVFFVAFLTASITSARQAKPLREMAEAARRFGHGEFDTRVPTGNRQDEIGELAEAFNTMADSLALADRERSEFIANVSHELKTPMTTIAGFADGILDGTIPPEKQRDALCTVSSETRRLSRLVRRMLDLSRLQAGDAAATQEPFDITEVLLRVLVSLEGKINEKELDVETDLPEDPLRVWGDPDGITQVCYNLLDNAIKFSAPGTTLRLSISAKGGKAHVSVENTGETIPPEELKRIFDRFHKTDRSRSMDREGVGLGLYIVRSILDAHKESITVASENGVTRFTFTLSPA